MSPRRLRRRLRPWAVVGLLLLAFALRTHALGERELSFDEVGSVFIASRGPLGLLAYLREAVREHPPLYYLLLSLWLPLVGQSEFAARFLSVGIGLATAAATYLLVRRASRRSTAMLTTFVLVISPFHVGASQDARMYGLLALWSLLSMFIFVRLLSQDRMRWWGLFWLVTGLGIFTHYYMAFVLAAEDLFLLLNWRRYRRLWARWAVIHLVLGGGIGLWIVLSPGLWATLISLWDRGVASNAHWHELSRAFNGLYLGATLRPNWYHLALPLLLTAVGVGVAQWRNLWLPRGHRHGGLLLGLLLGMPLTALLALPERIVGRYLTAALPASVLSVGLALDWSARRLANWLVARWADRKLPRRPLSLALGYLPFLVLLLGIVYTDVCAYRPLYSSSGESYRDRMRHLRSHARPDDGLLLHGPWQTLLTTYYDPGLVKRYTVPLSGLQVETGPAEETLADVFNANDRVWVSYDSVEPVDPNWIVARWLHENAYQVWSKGGLALYRAPPAQGLRRTLIERSSEGNASGARIGPIRAMLPAVVRDRASGSEHVERKTVCFGERLRLVGMALAATEPASGDAVLLLTQWRAVQHIPHGLVLRLELVGPAGGEWGHYQFRAGPAHVPTPGWGAGQTFAERRGLVIPVGTPPGDYALQMRVFSPEGDEWLPEGGEPFEVGPVRVSRPATAGARPRESLRQLEALPGRELQATFGDKLALVGYEPGGLRFTQGNPLLFEVYWQALAAPRKEYVLEIELVDEEGTALVKQAVQPIAEWFPTDRWKTGDLLLGHYAVPLPVDAAPGRYQIRLTVYASGGSPLPVEGTRGYKILDWWDRERTLSGTDVKLLEVQIEARPRRYRVPAMEHELDVVLGSDVRLLGYDLASASVRPGGAVKLTLYWQALRRIECVYAVFNHVIGPDGALLAQMDSWPREGAYPTTQWLPGEIVDDHYAIPVPLDALPGEYILRVGVYNAATDERPITLVAGTPAPERYVRLTTITVKE